MVVGQHSVAGLYRCWAASPSLPQRDRASVDRPQFPLLRSEGIRRGVGWKKEKKREKISKFKWNLSKNFISCRMQASTYSICINWYHTYMSCTCLVSTKNRIVKDNPSQSAPSYLTYLLFQVNGVLKRRTPELFFRFILIAFLCDRLFTVVHSKRYGFKVQGDGSLVSLHGE